MTDLDSTARAASPDHEDHDDGGESGRGGRDKFSRERNEGSGRTDAMEVDEFGRTVTSRKRRERSRTRSLSPPVAERRGKRRRSRSREREREGPDTYIPDYRNGSGPPRRRNNDVPITDIAPAFFGPMEGLPDPMTLDFLISRDEYGMWAREQHRKKAGPRAPTMSPDEVDRRYELYKENFNTKQLVKYFKQEKDSEWFREKYHPEESKPMLEEVKARRRELLAKFKKDLESGQHDDVSYDESKRGPQDGSAMETKDAEPKEEAKANNEDAPAEDGANAEVLLPTPSEDKSAQPPKEGLKAENIHALFIKGVPPKTPRKDLKELCAQAEGFKYLVLSDPKLDKNIRYGWIIFEDDADMPKALSTLQGKQIGEFTLSLALHHWQELRIRSIPGETNRPERLQKDLTQIKELSKVLDGEMDFDPESGVAIVESRLENVVLPKLEQQLESESETERKTAKVKRSLDLHIIYLRRVHCYDYYSGSEALSPEDFMRKTSVQLRRPAVDKKSSHWLERLDTRIDMRTHKPVEGSQLIKMGGKSLEAELDKHLKTYSKKETEGKYRCTECQKLFKGDEFVRKHVRTKHPERTLATIEEVNFFNNFVRDHSKVNLNYLAPPPMNGGGIPGGPPFGGPMPMMMPMMPMMPMGMNPFMMQQFMQMQGNGVGGGMGGGMQRNDRNGGRGGRNSLQGRLGPPPPKKPNARNDPRQIRHYDDLDNPVPAGEMEISYD